MAPLLIPAIAFAAIGLRSFIEVVPALDGGLHSDVVRHAFWAVVCAAGAVALATIATGRLA
ncbi:hypothetical protein [Methylobacterium sp. J-070]|uniref:hypothetical protein n=1 Tax=Methylobacterium sp. J-070 TaxID=2836650 RepID=UPI001FB974E6|nr:hypothetical protein [Methylobacterium sp. J-070]MCJ2051697.1 hypothetical protein [Methylobacterium sp. J-070]